MAEAVILEFSGVTAQHYAAVNELLGIDPVTGAGEWPSGLVSHVAGTTDEGTFVVHEVWASRDDQAAFLHDRLGAALAQGGVGGQPKVTWSSVLAQRALG